MIRRGLHIIMASLALVAALSGAAQACSIPMPACQSPTTGAWSELYGQQGRSDMLIYESSDDGAQDRLMVVVCPSRQALIINDPRAIDDDTYWQIEQVLADAIDSDQTYTLRQVRDQVNAAGGNGVLDTLPADHCACGPELQAPVDFYCPMDW